MTILAQFDGLELRETDEYDKPMLQEWIASDAAHAGEFEPEHFIGSEGCFALEDAAGVVFFIRLAKTARVRIQFNTELKSRKQRARVAQALARGMAVLELGLSRSGVTEWVFDTTNPDLKKFAIKWLGFKEQANDLVREICELEREVRETEVA